MRLKQQKAPATTDGPEAEEGDSSILWFIPLAILGFLLVGRLIGRGRKGETPPPVAADGMEGFKERSLR